MACPISKIKPKPKECKFMQENPLALTALAAFVALLGLELTPAELVIVKQLLLSFPLAVLYPLLPIYPY